MALSLEKARLAEAEAHARVEQLRLDCQVPALVDCMSLALYIPRDHRHAMSGYMIR